MKAASSFPNAVIVGAMKCGTTSLHSYLGAHPEIGASREKEPNFFLLERPTQRQVQAYLRLFPRNAPVKVEASQRYTTYPSFTGVPRRIHARCPEARLIYLVRDPIERLLSEYVFRIATDNEWRPFRQAIAEEPRYRLISRYFLQLEQYLEVFPAEQIMVLDSRQLREARIETLRQVFRFLGVDESVRSPTFDRVENVTRPRRKTAMGRVLLRGLVVALGERRAMRVRMRLPAVIVAPFTRPIARPVVDDALLAEFVEEFGRDAAQLRAHSGLRLEHWCV